MDKNKIKGLIGKEDPIILDVGSFDGADSDEFASIIPNSNAAEAGNKISLALL